MTRSIPVIDGLHEIVADYDAFLVDVWGVLHGGEMAFPGAADCLHRLRAAGKRVVILSNAPRRAANVGTQLVERGIATDAYDLLMTSGEATWRALHDRPDAFYRDLGRRCYHLGPNRYRGLTDGLDLEYVREVEEAGFILGDGPDRELDQVADYEGLLRRAAPHGVTFICANPDVEVIDRGRRLICSGTIAARYAELGGPVRYLGKPHPEIYERCFEAVGRPKRVLAIGDGLRTDILGAARVGIDGLLVTRGVHAVTLGLAAGDVGTGARPDAAAVSALCAEHKLTPRAAIATLQW
jgi:HAD superfamily hydrolase (TIGR01459 family)